VAPDLPDLRGAGGGSRRVVPDVFLLTTLVDLITDLYVVVQAIRFIDAVLVQLAILDVTVIILAIGLIWAFLIIGDIARAGRTDNFALDVHGDTVLPGHTGGRVGRRRRLPDQH
jgi:hypothetical protein